MDVFQQLKITKGNKHMLVIEALIAADLQFIETGEMIYKITNSAYKQATLFPLTGKCTVLINNKIVPFAGTWEEIINKLKGN